MYGKSEPQAVAAGGAFITSISDEAATRRYPCGSDKTLALRRFDASPHALRTTALTDSENLAYSANLKNVMRLKFASTFLHNMLSTNNTARLLRA